MPTALADGQAELRAGAGAALLVGDGTDYMWHEDGPRWWGAPDVRTTDQARAGSDGITPGLDLLGTHATTLIVSMLGDSESDVGDKIDAWKAACALSRETLVAVRANLLGRTRVRYGRFRIPGEADASLARTGWVAIGSAQFVALDPLTYGDDEVTAATSRAVAGSGFTPPFTPPFTLGVGTTGAVSITNGGNTTGPWTARLEGPLTNPTVTDLASGRRLAFSANGGVDIAADEWLTLDSATRSALLNDVADRRTQLTVDSDWWDLEPGEATFELTADAGTGVLTVTARDAWLS